MANMAAVLQALQHGDSFFPSGGMAFSWGLETLCIDGHIRSAEDVQAFLLGQLAGRWAICDRVALLRVFDAMPALATAVALDQELDTLALAREAREGSRRAGATLLRIHEQLQTPGAAAYREQVKAGTAFGHLPIVQGIVWSGVGMDQDAALATSAYCLCTGVLGAAIRLGVLGHVDAQRIQVKCQELLAALPPADLMEQLCSFTPQAEIAMMRHELQHSRLFSN